MELFFKLFSYRFGQDLSILASPGLWNVPNRAFGLVSGGGFVHADIAKLIAGEACEGAAAAGQLQEAQDGVAETCARYGSGAVALAGG